MSNNNNIDQQLTHPFLVKDQVRSFKRTIPVNIHDFYISDEIGDPDKYLELIHTLKSADQQDTICINLNTHGGNLYSTVQIMSAMVASAAKVVTCLEGQVCSAGTFIFLKGDVKVVNPNCTFMIHDYSQITSGKGNEIARQVGYMDKYFSILANDVYSNFLTDDEMKSVMAGVDMWMHSHDVVKRLKENGHEFVYTGTDMDDYLDIEVTAPEIKVAHKKEATKKEAVRKKTARKKTSTKK
jgi:ATP-dependent protease ClpP protease subunit